MSAANGAGAGGTAKAAQPCTICGKPQVRAYRPFCSKRCADVDLGRWLGGRYAIPGEPAELSDEQANAPTPGEDPDEAPDETNDG